MARCAVRRTKSPEEVMHAGPPLLERDAELSEIAARIQAAAGGRGSTLVLEGPAGIGKSRLLEAAVELAGDHGLRILSARCGELEQDLGWGVARDLFEPLLRDAQPGEHEALLAGAGQLALAPLGHRAEVSAGHGAAMDTAGAVHGLHWLAANLAAREPALLTVDDAHWADAPSLRWLAHLAARVDDLALAIVVTARPQDPREGDPLPSTLAAGAKLLRLAPLSEASSEPVVRAALGRQAEPSFVRACHSATGGNPFLLRELTNELAAEGLAPIAAHAQRIGEIRPATVGRAVLLRLARLGPAATQLAEAVSVLGADAQLPEAAALAGLDEATASAAADALSRAEILVPGLPLRFAHPVVRTLVYDELGALKRMRWHARAARLVAEAGAPADAVALHLLSANPQRDPDVVAQLRGAARDALTRGAPDAAVTYLRRALQEPPPAADLGALLGELGEAEASAGDPQARRHLEQALGESSGGERGRVALVLGRLLTMSGQSLEAVELLDRVRAELGAQEGELAQRLEVEAADAARNDFRTSASVAGRLRRMHARLDSESHLERLALAGMAMQRALAGNSARAACDLAERALAGGRLIAQEGADSGACYLAIHALVVSDRLDEAMGHLEAAFADAGERGSAPGFATASVCRSHAHYLRGSILEALADARAALELAREGDWQAMVPWGLAFRIDALVERGELEEAAAELERSGLTGELPEIPYFEPLHRSRARLALARGDATSALSDLFRCGRRLAETGAPNPAMSSWRSTAAAALASLGDRAQALELVGEEVELARAYGAPRALGIALREQGRLADGGPQGLALLREAVAVLEGSPAQLEHARALTDLGAALRRAGARTQARDALLRGLTLAWGCGATALGERVRGELGALGLRPRRAALAGRDALTAAELRVARRAARGETNRAIAQALIVSLRTVETHLTHAYQKLGIDARDQLAAALQRTDRG